MDNNDFEGLIDEIKNAEKQCNEVDEPQKTIFKTMLKSLRFIATAKRSYPLEEDNYITETETNLPEYVQKLSKITKINVTDLEHIFNFEDENIELVANINAQNEKEKQFKATLCILTAYTYCFDQKEIKSSDLIKQLENLGIGSMSNLSPYLSTYTQFIKVDGKNRTYKIKGPGINKGKEIIKELVSQEKGETCE